MPRTKQNANLKKGNPETQFKSGRQAVENGRKGGINSGRAKRQRKTMAQMAQVFAALPVPEQTKRQLQALGVSEEDAVHQMALVAAMFSAGEKGNVRAAALITEWMNDNKDADKNGVLDDILDAVRGVGND